MSIADKIILLQNARNAIRTKLVEKGITDASNHGFSQFADDIANINISSDAVIIVAKVLYGPSFEQVDASYKLQTASGGVGTFKLIFSPSPVQSTVYSGLNSESLPEVGANLYTAKTLTTQIGTITEVKIL